MLGFKNGKAWAVLIAAAMVLGVCAEAEAGGVFDRVQSKKILRCRVSEGLTGFSIRDASGTWSGMDVDFCRAVAAAMGPGVRVDLVPLTASERFVALKMGNLIGVGFSLLAAIAVLSSLLANIPVVAATILMVKGYFVILQMVPEEALGTGFSDWPPAAMPVFVAMMFGATLGGNATLIGASANIVAAGICAVNGKTVGFSKYLRYGIPVTAAQLAVSALYVGGALPPARPSLAGGAAGKGRRP